MAYTPKEWECGETITAEALNHMEQGIAEASSGGGEDSNVFIVKFTLSGSFPNPTVTADKTLEEIATANEEGKLIKGLVVTTTGVIVEFESTVVLMNGEVGVMFTSPIMLDASTADYLLIAYQTIMYTPQGIGYQNVEHHVVLAE